MHTCQTNLRERLLPVKTPEAGGKNAAGPATSKVRKQSAYPPRKATKDKGKNKESRKLQEGNPVSAKDAFDNNLKSAKEGSNTRKNPHPENVTADDRLAHIFNVLFGTLSDSRPDFKEFIKLAIAYLDRLQETSESYNVILYQDVRKLLLEHAERIWGGSSSFEGQEMAPAMEIRIALELAVELFDILAKFEEARELNPENESCQIYFETAHEFTKFWLDHAPPGLLLDQYEKLRLLTHWLNKTKHFTSQREPLMTGEISAFAEKLWGILDKITAVDEVDEPKVEDWRFTWMAEFGDPLMELLHEARIRGQELHEFSEEELAPRNIAPPLSDREIFEKF
ncbi:MAG: hypothetical protein Q9190_001262, partial [Brigantiaea leucoxantha]